MTKFGLCFDDVKRAKAYYDREGVVCVHNSMSDIRGIRETTASLPLYDDARVSSRKTACLPPSHALPNALYHDPELKDTFYYLHGYKLHPSDFPVEYREYKPFSKGMGWHTDLPLYEDKKHQDFQVEMVLTVFNDDSDTRFEWIDRRGETNSIVPKQNDMVFVRPGGPLHRVLPLGNNTRGIVKMVAHRPGAVPLPSVHSEKKNCPMVGKI